MTVRELEVISENYYREKPNKMQQCIKVQF